MFISKTEKQELFQRIAVLESRVIRLEAWPKPVHGNTNRVMSEENKAKASARMKAWHANKKARA
jgi:hypothetical protein